jgi:hypothetical protein
MTRGDKDKEFNDTGGKGGTGKKVIFLFLFD